MQIFETFPSFELAEPKAYRSLRDLGDVPLFHVQFGNRHPVAMYSTALSNVGRKILRVADLVSEAQLSLPFLKSGSTPPVTDDLLDATGNMINALMEYMEDCEEIIKNFFSPGASTERDKVLAKYKKEVIPYRKHIGTVANFIKHNQGRLRLFTCDWDSGSSLGYFVEGPIDESGVGPSKVVHKDGNSAFSYYRDLPFHVCNVYAVSAQLSYALHSIDKAIKPRSVTYASPEVTPWTRLLPLLATWPRLFFPDELKMPVPAIVRGRNQVSIEYPSPRSKTAFMPNSVRLTVIYNGDGFTTTFKLPYS